MSKKILSVLLAVALIASCFTVLAFAAGNGIGYEEDETYTQAWALSVPVDNGDGTWSVDVTLTANYKVGAIQFEVTNTDNTNVRLTGFALSSAIPTAWNSESNFSNESGIVAIIPEPTEDAVDAIDCVNGVTLGTLTYTVTGDATATIKINNSPKSETNPGGTLIAARMEDGNVVTSTPIVGQVATVGDSRVIGAAQPAADPVLKGVDTGVVDATNFYVYGVPAGANAADYFTVENGTVTFSGNGTGATATVKKEDGTEFKTYTLIIFGDVNGDGAITGADSTVVTLASLGNNIADANYAFAADVNGDGAVTGADSTVVTLGSLGTVVTVNPFA